MQKKFDVIALGELLIDFIEEGISPQGNPLLEANPGGAPCNVLSMLQSLNKKTAFIGKVGNDGFGNMLKEKVKSRGVDTSCLKLDNNIHTTLAIVTKTSSGDRDFSFYRKPGADINLEVSDIDEEFIKDSKIFHFGTLSFTDEPALSAAKKGLSLAKENNLIITFDPNLRPPLWNNLDDAHHWTDYGLRYADVLKISDNEIEWFTGLSDYNQGIDKLFNDYPNLKLIAVTLGPDGSIGSTRTSRTFVKAYKNSKTIETTGCGDTFMACLINSVLEKGLDQNESDLEETLKFANAAASIVSTRKGALMIMPSINEVNNFLKERE